MLMINDKNNLTSKIKHEFDKVRHHNYSCWEKKLIGQQKTLSNPLERGLSYLKIWSLFGICVAKCLMRSIPWRYFFKKGFRRNFEKFTEKHLCQSLFFNKVAGLRRLLLSSQQLPIYTNQLLKKIKSLFISQFFLKK